MGSAAQGGPMRPQQPQQPQQQRPMGQQGKGPGLPMPQQPNMGGNRPYQPVGANNGPFHQNPVQPVNQPPQMPSQGKAPGQPIQPGQPMPQPAPGNSLMDLVKNAGGQPMQQPVNPNIPQPIASLGGKGPQSPFNTPAQAGPAQVQNNNPGLMQ